MRMLVTHTERPRELRWYHAGPMLYGDWGTSRFYVLGLAFYFAFHASFYYVAGVCALVAAVGWAYTIICRCYPDGGGVYSAAKGTSRVLAVIGALLLFADYIVTASLSALDGMHYFGIPDGWVAVCAIAAIVLIGVINYVGPKKAGTFALVVALATLAVTLVLLVFSIPHLRAGLEAMHRPTEGAGHQWRMLVNVVLALSGVEAIANMTGIMVPPVEKTSKRAIWPVLLEVVILNLIFAVAMNGLTAVTGVDIGRNAKYPTPYAKVEAAEEIKAGNPGWEKDPALKAEVESLALTHDEDDAKNAVLRFMGKHYVGAWFAAIAGVVFGLLLLSAVNTAVADMISIQYVMSRDGELPKFLTRLNVFGVPWLALLPAVVLPVVILCFVTDLEKLADLYAIGVVGAIAINLGSCTANLKMPLKGYERAGMGVLAVVMVAIELTLAWQKPHALLFAGAVLGGGLAMRFVTKSYLPARAKRKAEAAREVVVVERAASAPTEVIDASRPKVLVATRGGERLMDFAARYARDIQGTLFVLFVRQINVIAMGTVAAPGVEEDGEASGVFRKAGEAARKYGVPMVPIYVTSSDVAYAILDFAATYDVHALLMGVSREGALLRALKGDVIGAVADHLPEDIPLLIHA